MKKFTKQEIDGTREYFHSRNMPEIQVTLGNRAFTYFVLPQSLEPNLPDFVFRCTGKHTDGYVFGISDSVKAEYRQYAVAHEFIEFTEIGIDNQNRCARALEEELKLVPENIKSDYLTMRRNFFKNLITYCTNKLEQYTEADLNEFRNSLAKLEEFVKK